MKLRSTLLSFAAVMTTALLVGAGGAAYADNVVVDGDSVTTNVPDESVALGTIACGTSASRTISIDIKQNGNYPSTNVFEAGALLSLTASANHADVGVTVASGDAGTIKIPSNWATVPNNTTSGDPAYATVTVSAATEGPHSAIVSMNAIGKGSASASLSRPATIAVTWTVGACAPIKTDTETKVTCTASVVFTGLAIAPCTATVTGANLSAPVDVTYSANIEAGTVTATAIYGGDSTHNGSTGSATFAITRAPSTTIVSCPTSVPYTGSAQTPCTAHVEAVGGLDLELEVTHSANTDAGTATATASYPGDKNHAASTHTVEFAIDPASATCNVLGFAGEYDGDFHGAEGTCTGIGGIDLSTGLDLGEKFKDVAGGTAHWKFEYANYAPQIGTAQIVLSKAASAISLQCESAVYDGTGQEPCTATVTGVGGLSEDLTVTYENNTNAGTATASASYEGDVNHTPSETSTTFEIAKAASITTLDCPATATYDGSAHSCTASTTGAGGLVATPAITYDGDTTNAGTVKVTASYPGDDNHTESEAKADLVIAKASSSITLVCEPASVVYTGLAQTPCTATVETVGAPAAADVSYTDNTNAGTATVTAAWAGDSNREGSSSSVQFEIAKAPSVVTVSCPASVVFTGSAIEPCTAHVTGANLDQAVSPILYSNNTAVSKENSPASASAAYAGDVNHEGSTGSATFQIAAWTLQGFYKPVDMIVNGVEVVNIVKGGSTVPLKFNAFAGSTEITNTTALGARFTFRNVGCSVAAQTSDDLIATTGGTTLRYDATAKQWIQNWQTPKGADQCLRVTLTTADGSTLTALFRTK